VPQLPLEQPPVQLPLQVPLQAVQLLAHPTVQAILIPPLSLIEEFYYVMHSVNHIYQW
jgi:hypothetical protein